MKKDNIRKKRNAYVLFTREPVPGFTKTRLMPYYTAEQCAELHECFLRDIAHEMMSRDFDIIVSYTGGEPSFLKKTFGRKAKYIEQRGNGLGQRMENAISDVLAMGYEKAVLTGSDIPELEAETIEASFAMLSASDIVIGPTSDGGYYLIGMKKLLHEAFDVKTYGVSTVFEETVSAIEAKELTVAKVDEYHDIDTNENLADLRRRIVEDIHLRRSETGRFVAENLRISVIVPVFNEEKTAGSMKAQLKKATQGRSDIEVIFVDGESTDSTLEVLGDDFTVLRSKKGRAVQMNTGAINSTGDVLFFLHCDSTLPEDFISEIKNCMKRKLFGCFGVKFDSCNFFMLTNRIISNNRAVLRGLVFGDQGIFIDRRLFFEEGMFPEIPVMEDYQFSRILKRMGYRPAIARRRIMTSSRRYGKGTVSIVKTEMLMWYLRMLYRHGADPGRLKDMYKDIREKY